MFAPNRSNTTLSAILRFVDVVYHGAVRSIRRTDGNALIGLIKSIGQTIMMVAVFAVMLSSLGMRQVAIQGDYFIYLMTGIFVFMTHVKTIGAVAMSEGPTSPMMQHAPMNTLVSILSAALSTLYIQFLGLIFMLFIYHVGWNRVTIDDVPGSIGMVFLAWYTGIGTGLIFLAAKPWFPGPAGMVQQVYTRVNLFASGKLTVGNTLPFWMLPYFTWNPLFHIIDQMRGFVFINYNPHFSNWPYAFYVGTAMLMVGFIAEGYTRRHASLSWYSKR